MAEVARYADIIKRVIREYAAIRPAKGDIAIETVFDDAGGHYELTYAGWDGYFHIHGSVIHVDIRDGKVWIQHDGTEGGIASELVEAGIPPDHIVLAFHHPDKRQYTSFAVA
ncbi:MAG: XisI protein [Armatimonadetes bacterium]|nr:XisI protein [Armatimonadota bacterium]